MSSPCDSLSLLPLPCRSYSQRRPQRSLSTNSLCGTTLPPTNSPHPKVACTLLFLFGGPCDYLDRWNMPEATLGQLWCIPAVTWQFLLSVSWKLAACRKGCYSKTTIRWKDRVTWRTLGSEMPQRERGGGQEARREEIILDDQSSWTFRWLQPQPLSDHKPMSNSG